MTKLAIVGYGNLGKALERIAHFDKDTQLVGVFTRRNPKDMTSPFDTPFYSQEEIECFQGEVDVVALCTGSATDLVPLALKLNTCFNTVDTFDNHGKIREYVMKLDKVARGNNHLSVVGAGWDPGVFSLMRGLFESFGGKSHTFWGAGVSQGHSEAIRKLKGVKMAVQYTIPSETALEKVKNGLEVDLKLTDKHLRECYVVVDDSVNKSDIENQIKNMPNYFLGYNTKVHFVDEDDFIRNHSRSNHGGIVVENNITNGHKSQLQFSLQLDSNPDFTAKVLFTYAKYVKRQYEKGDRGVKTILDIPISGLFDIDWLDIVEKYV